MKNSPEETTITTELSKIRMRCADLLKDDSESELNDLELVDGSDFELRRNRKGGNPYDRTK